MDNLTHSLTALMLHRAGIGCSVPRGAWLMVAAANIPDLDVVAGFQGSAAYLDHHRGWTHGVAVAPLAAVLFGVILRAVNPRFPLIPTAIALATAIYSHLFLDWTNMYGIRLLAPFSGEWFRADIAPVVDAGVLGLLIGGVAWHALSRLVGGEIGVRAKPPVVSARVVLALVLGWLGARWVMHERALEQVNAHIYPGGEPRQVAVIPWRFHPLRWRVLIEQPDQWRVIPLGVGAEFDPEAGFVLQKPESIPSLEAVKRTAPFAALGRFSRTLFYQVAPAPEPEGATEVRVTDLRFGLPREGSFEAMAIVTRAGQVEEPELGFFGGRR